MKATIEIEDTDTGVHIGVKLSEAIDDNTRSNAVDAALIAMQAITGELE